MSVTTGVFVFDQVDELDFVGPLDVFSYAAWGHDGDKVLLIGPNSGPLSGVNGLNFTPHHDLANAPELDILVIAGGYGSAVVAKDERVLRWVREVAGSARFVCSVCTGAFVLHAAGLMRGRALTTHAGMVGALREAGADLVVEGQRYVIDGKFVTAAGVSAGIDMALWIVGQVYGTVHALRVQDNLEYHPAPPYQDVRRT